VPKFERNQKAGESIPTASMGDIVFLLLIFFMVTTVFKTEDGLPVDLPRAESGNELKRENIANIYMDRRCRISINDKLVDTKMVGPIMTKKLEANPQLVVAFHTDDATDYKCMDDVMEELKLVNAVRISFNNKIEGAQVKF
jgi:biopolymer transport protein ExbD